MGLGDDGDDDDDDYNYPYAYDYDYQHNPDYSDSVRLGSRLGLPTSPHHCCRHCAWRP
jgi:hypothetical protein